MDLLSALIHHEAFNEDVDTKKIFDQCVTVIERCRALMTNPDLCSLLIGTVCQLLDCLTVDSSVILKYLCFHEKGNYRKTSHNICGYYEKCYLSWCGYYKRVDIIRGI